jgi:hypothetical protein
MPCFHLYSQVFHILEAVPQVAQEWVVQVLQHPSFSYYIPHAFRADDFIFSDVFEGEGEASIFPLDNSNFAESAFADDS